MDAPAVARTPTGRKLQLAALLRHLREKRHLTQHEAGRAVWSRASAASVQNKIARLESADTGITIEDLDALLRVYAASDDHRRLATTLNSELSQRGRWQGYRSVYSESYRRYVDLEEDAELIRFVANERIPEVLQCEAYARAERPSGQMADLAVQAQQARQQVLLRDAAPWFYAVLSESSVRGVQGDEHVMAGQVEHLITLSRRPNVTVQVVPFNTGRGPRVITQKGILERFALIRLASPGVLGELPRHLDYAFTRVGDELNWSDDVQHYEDLWSRASSAALSPHETRAFLRCVAKDFR
ncbi:helix-turn-helix domain-containing protein [Amycolatopsis alkalitolerans]|uniref:Helix-turn-helix domain-containing protein n=1 Tax=Amycolatopsis alkalitolerans TaxID=2547244 RepID=A0A5C4MBK5_9PSEU|nr:helix-turn-helix transcriptional regulator [Amycolatopsis alkalitolerans]TNC29670.1 helix-turn-helix domain-containing protein [Amycolatopsis alkalitolerans]